MSVVASYIADDGKIHVAWDSALSNDGEVTCLIDDKVWVKHGVGYGFVGDVAVYTALKTAKYPVPPKDLKAEDVEGFVLRKIVPMVRRAIAPVNEEIQTIQSMVGQWSSPEVDFALLIMMRGQVFQLGGQRCLWRERRKFQAIGSGAAFVLGHLACQQPDGGDVVLAVAECISLCPTIDHPVHYLVVE